jgi:hypothetical protein
VTPCAARRTAAFDQEGRPFGDVLQPAEVVGDAECAHGIAVPVGQELDLAEVERLARPRWLRRASSRSQVSRIRRPRRLFGPWPKERLPDDEKDA